MIGVGGDGGGGGEEKDDDRCERRAKSRETPHLCLIWARSRSFASLYFTLWPRSRGGEKERGERKDSLRLLLIFAVL